MAQTSVRRVKDQVQEIRLADFRSLSFLGFILYILTAVTSRLPIGQIGVVLGLVGLLAEGRRVHLPTYLRWWLAFVMWSGLSILWSIDSALSIAAFVESVKLWLILFLGVNAVRRPSQQVLFTLVVLAGFLAYPGRGAINNYLVGNTYFGRVGGGGALSNPNYLAAACLTPISLAIALAFRSGSKLVHIAALGIGGICTVIILLTQSRAGMLGLGVLMLAGVGSLSGMARKIRATVVIICIGLVALAFAPDGVLDRVTALASLGSGGDARKLDEEGSAAARIDIVFTGLKIISEHHVFGVGTGTYSLAQFQYNPVHGIIDAHNTYVHVTAEAGYMGLLFFLGMVATLVLESRERIRRIRRDAPWAASALAVVLTGFLAYMVEGIWGSYDRWAWLHLHALLLYTHVRHIATAPLRLGSVEIDQLPTTR